MKFTKFKIVEILILDLARYNKHSIGVDSMRKITCEICGEKRGRRQCLKLNNKNICGECCSSMQLTSSCPLNCVHLGKLSPRDFNNKVRAMIENAIKLRQIGRASCRERV